MNQYILVISPLDYFPVLDSGITGIDIIEDERLPEGECRFTNDREYVKKLTRSEGLLDG